MIQVITPHLLQKGTIALKEAFIRFAPKRGELVLSSALMELIGHDKGQSIYFAFDAQSRQIFVASKRHFRGFKVNVDAGRGRIYSKSLHRLAEHIIGQKITESISVPVETLSTEINGHSLFKLCLDALKQRETVSNDRLAITVYKGKAYNKKTLLSLIRGYYTRSFSSLGEVAKLRNKAKYESLKHHCKQRELDIDFVQIENSGE